MPKIYQDLPRRRNINTLESVKKNLPFFYGVAAKLQLREAARQMATLAAATSRYGAGNPKIAPKILSNLPIHGFFLFIGQVEGVRIAFFAMMAGAFFSISIYIGVFLRFRHYLVTSANKNPRYLFKVLVVCMV